MISGMMTHLVVPVGNCVAVQTSNVHNYEDSLTIAVRAGLLTPSR